MKLKLKVLVLLLFATASVIQAKKTCSEIHLAGIASSAHPTANHYFAPKPLGGEGSIVVIDDDLVVDSKGGGNITHVQIKNLSGTVIASYGGCGDKSICSYSLTGLDHNTYHVIVTTTGGTFSGDISW